MLVIKRDGRQVDFDENKIIAAIAKATLEAKSSDWSPEQCDQFAAEVTFELVPELTKGKNSDDKITIEEIQDRVVQKLSDYDHAVATAYDVYRRQRTRIRNMKSTTNQVIAELVSTKDIDDKRENANIDAQSTMGSMLKIGSTVAKEFNLTNLIKPKHAEMHRNGVIHIHDLDFYALCPNCLFIPLTKLLDNGFSTGHGYLRTPTTIGAAATLTCIAIQSSQNDFFGGQAIPSFDFSLAPYVAKSFVRNLVQYISIVAPELTDETMKDRFIKPADTYIKEHRGIMKSEQTAILVEKLKQICKDNELDGEAIDWAKAISWATKKTDKDTYQAMEATVHNLCTLNSRCGSQVPFSSINFGLDISPEGRMVIKNILLATDAGLGHGETAIFPISIFKIKNGITDKGSPNYDLFKLSCKVSAKRLFPNWVSLNPEFNAKYFKPDDPDTHVATMGCRTRVIGNVFDPSHEITTGRGNLFFTTLNLPYAALALKEELGDQKLADDVLLDTYIQKLDKIIDEILDFSKDRFNVIAKRMAKNYPFSMGQHEYVGSESLLPDTPIREVLKQGTLSIGYIGLAETLVCLFGKHHGESKHSQKMGLKIISHLKDRMDQAAKKENMNYSVIATPAEGCSGRLLRLTRKRFGVVPGVTDREFFTNGNHVPVWYHISAYDKIRIEAPYHELCTAGNISYIELDADATKNLKGFEDLVTFIANSGCGYFSINHPCDRDPVCGYVGAMRPDGTCPRCGRKNGQGVPAWKLLSLRSYNPDPKYAVKSSMFEEEIATMINPVNDMSVEDK